MVEGAATRVLRGLGGVGKTQLAAGYAEQAWTRGGVDLLMWLAAGDRQGVVTGYAQAATEILDAPADDAVGAADRFLAWLATTERRWLIVLDDVYAPADLSGLWPPERPTGEVLVTTRRRDVALAGRRRRLIDVDVFTPQEAAGYLAAKLPDERPAELAGLAADLGHLPLALAQAVAYLTDRGLDAAGYRRRLADRRRTLAQLVPEPAALPDEHRTTLAATWSLSVDAAEGLQPTGLARPMLELAALLAPSGIPRALLATDAVVTYLRAARDSARTGGSAAASSGEPVDTDAAEDALHNLVRLSLASVDGDLVRVHALVQRATHEPLDPERRDHAARAAADGLLSIWPDPERDHAFSQVLRANTAVLREHAEAALFNPDCHELLFRAGDSLYYTGQPAAARAASDELAQQCVRVFGPDHLDTVAARLRAARWRAEAGDRAGAVTLFEPLLVDALRVLGPDHEVTLGVRGNLAHWRARAGDPAGAVDALEQLRADLNRVVGADHPDTLTTRHNLAFWRGQIGDKAAAVAEMEEVLADRQRVLGPDHRQTLTTRHDLAHLRGQAGDFAGALAAFEELLVDQLRVLGADHPQTLAARRNLATYRGEAGDAAGALAAFGELLVDQVRVLGPEHPETLASRGEIAVWGVGIVPPEQTVTAYEQLLADLIRVLGPDDLDTLTTRFYYAHARGDLGDAAGAVAALEELLTDQLRVLGRDRPQTQDTEEALAYWRDEAED